MDQVFFWIWPKTVYRAKIEPKNTVLIFVHLKGMKIRNPARGIYLHLSRIMQNFILGFRIFDGQKFSFKLMSDQQGLKGGDINTAFKRGNLPFMEISNNFHKKYLTRFFSILRVNFETKFIYGP